MAMRPRLLSLLAAPLLATAATRQAETAAGLRPADWAERHAALRSLDASPLQAADQELLASFLRRPDQEGVDRRRLNQLRNDAAALLLRQPGREVPNAHLLLETLRTPGHDPVWRDYCVQFLGALLPCLEGWHRDGVIGRLLLLAGGDRDPIAATALVALARQPRLPPDTMRLLRQRVLHLTNDDSIPPPLRVSAMAVCARLSLDGALPAARRLLDDEQAPVPVRLASIGLLAQLGRADDRTWLRRLANHPDSRLRLAARRWLHRMSAPLHPPANALP